MLNALSEFASSSQSKEMEIALLFPIISLEKLIRVAETLWTVENPKPNDGFNDRPSQRMSPSFVDSRVAPPNQEGSALQARRYT